MLIVGTGILPLTMTPAQLDDISTQDQPLNITAVDLEGNQLLRILPVAPLLVIVVTQAAGGSETG